MEVDQALRALSQLKDAAPPTTSARLGEVIALVRQLDADKSTLQAKIAAQQVETGVLPKVQTGVLPQGETGLLPQIDSAAPQIQTGVLPRAATDLLPQALDSLKPSMQLVRGQSEALRSGRLGRITTEQADCLKLIFEHAASALTLLDTLDEIALLRQGLLRIEPHVFSGLDLLAEAWQRRADDAEVRDHRIEIHADDPLPMVEGDYRHILTILVDLLDNAVRYTPYGGVIRITAEAIGSTVLFSVADNGIGMDTDDVEHVGQAFWRAMHQPLVRQHPGAGLRLYRAQQILALQGSELFFSGEPGMGSTFSFTLPVGDG